MADRVTTDLPSIAVSYLGAGTGTNDVGTSGQVLISGGESSSISWANATDLGGDVDGPASSTDNALVRFDGTTGKLIQNSTITLTDAGSIQGANEIQVASGSETTPSITFTGDTNLGLFRKAADSLGFTAAGTEVGSYTSAGAFTFGSSGGSQTHTMEGSLDITDNLDVDGITTRGSTTSDVHVTNGTDSFPLNINTFTGTSTNFSNTPRYRKLTNAGAKTVQGIAAGNDQELTFLNSGGDLTIVNESGSAAAERRIITGTGSDITVTGDGAVTFYYDSNSQRWRVVSYVS